MKKTAQITEKKYSIIFKFQMYPFFLDKYFKYTRPSQNIYLDIKSVFSYIFPRIFCFCFPSIFYCKYRLCIIHHYNYATKYNTMICVNRHIKGFCSKMSK